MTKFNHRQFITQAAQAGALFSTIKDAYSNYWKISESEDSLFDNTIFITYRIPNLDSPKDMWMSSFRIFTQKLIRSLCDDFGCRKTVNDRRPVGMYAMDYDGSRQGHYISERNGPHIHSVCAIHPEMRAITLARLDEWSEEHGSKFFYCPIKDEGKSVEEMIHYSLKGIMHPYGFYHGRSDQYDLLGPRIEEGA